MNGTKEKKESTREIEAGVLFYVDGLLKFIEDKEITFEDALIENLLQFNYDEDYCQMAYKTIKTLLDKGYIEGYVELGYEEDYTNMNAVVYTDKIDYYACVFKDIKVTEKGKKMLETDELILSLKHLIKEMGGGINKGGRKVLEEIKKVIEEGKNVMPTVTATALAEVVIRLIILRK